MSDIYFEWRPAPKGTAMCGFGIYGNHLSSQDPKIEWDVHVDETACAGGLRASFPSDLTLSHEDRLTFTMLADPGQLFASASLGLRASQLMVVFSHDRERPPRF
jgi:hypothetical protein